MLASTAFMVMQSQWWHSTIVECYAVNAVFTAGALWILSAMRRGSVNVWLPRLFLLAGLALFNHVQLGFLAVGATVLLLAQLPLRAHPRRSRGGIDLRAWFTLALRSSALFLLGFLPFAVTFALDASASGVAAAARAATGGQFQGLMFQGHVIQAVIELVYLLGLQFPSPFLLLALGGVFVLARSWPRDLSISLLVMFAVNTVFFIFFNTWDRFAFLLPSFGILAFAGGVAADWLFRWMERSVLFPGSAIPAAVRRWMSAALWLIAFASCVLLPPWLYSRIAIWGSQPGLAYLRWNNNYTLNSHRASEFIANPNKRNWNDVERFSDLLFAKLPPNAVLFDDDSRTFYPLQFAQRHLHRRPDLRIEMMNSWGFSGWGVESRSLGGILRGLLDQKQQVFLVSIDRPFSDVLKGAVEMQDVVFERFPLDETHWVYRLRLDADSARSAIPAMRRLYTGRMSAGGFVHFSDIGTRGPLGAETEFDTNYRSLPVLFRWFGPDGSMRYESEPYTVQPGNTAVWSLLKLQGPREPGRWTVRFYMDGREMLATEFDVKQE